MKRQHKITVAIVVSLALAFVLLTWTFVPMVGPLIGIRRTPDEVIEFIKRRNIILLVDPVPVIKDGNGSYHDWAFDEISMRCKVAVLALVVGTMPLGFWAARQNRKRVT